LRRTRRVVVGGHRSGRDQGSCELGLEVVQSRLLRLRSGPLLKARGLGHRLLRRFSLAPLACTARV
jgi:hypothetical protein